MDFTKSVKFLTFAIIISITVDYTNGNYEECKKLFNAAHIPITYTAHDVFQHAYKVLDLTIISSLGSNTAILRTYIEEIYNVAITNYMKYRLRSPLSWCYSYLKPHLPKEQFEIENMCTLLLNKTRFKPEYDVYKALEVAYNEINIYSVDTNIEKKYYSYLSDIFLKHNELSHVKGPKEYCEDLHNGGGNGNEASTSGAQLDDNPEIDLNLTL